MLRLLRRRPAAVTTPARSAIPVPTVQREVQKNQNQSAALWSDTERDIAISNIVNEGERVQQSRRQIVFAAIVAIILLFVGTFYTYRNIQHDRLLKQERGAAQQQPYAPQAVIPSR